MKKIKEVIVHKDQVGQDINVDNYVAFSSSYHTGVMIGRVIKLTPQKIRVNATRFYTREGIETKHTYEHTPIPSEVIVLNDTLSPHLTMLALKGRI